MKLITHTDRERQFFNQFGEIDYEAMSNGFYEIFLKIVDDVYAKYFSSRKELVVLEVGCGTGAFGRKLIDHLTKRNIDCKVTGLEISDSFFQFLERKKFAGYCVLKGDARDLNILKEKNFDLILCPFILHHFFGKDIEKVVTNLDHWVSKKGVVLAVEPNGLNFCLKLSHLVGRLYRLLDKDTVWISPGEIVHPASLYKRVFQSKGFILKKAVFTHDNGILKTKGLIYWLVVVKNFFSRIAGGNIVILSFQKNGRSLKST